MATATAGLSEALFERGEACGGCYEVRCVEELRYCIPGTSIVLTATNFCAPNYGLPSAKITIWKAGVMPIQFRRKSDSKGLNHRLRKLACLNHTMEDSDDRLHTALDKNIGQGKGLNGYDVKEIGPQFSQGELFCMEICILYCGIHGILIAKDTVRYNQNHDILDC